MAKWTKQVELPKVEEAQAIHLGHNKRLKRLESSTGKLINIKPKYNPFTKSIMYTGTGFPDFICFKLSAKCLEKHRGVYEIDGVECKSNGYLTKEEKEKCKWYLDNDIFSKILIAKKGKKRGEIVYEEIKGGEIK